jgi:hypothetical protein
MGVVVSTPALHAGDPGPIPGGVKTNCITQMIDYVAAIVAG